MIVQTFRLHFLARNASAHRDCETTLDCRRMNKPNNSKNSKKNNKKIIIIGCIQRHDVVKIQTCRMNKR